MRRLSFVLVGCAAITTLAAEAQAWKKPRLTRWISTVKAKLGKHAWLVPRPIEVRPGPDPAGQIQASQQRQHRIGRALATMTTEAHQGKYQGVVAEQLMDQLLDLAKHRHGPLASEPHFFKHGGPTSSIYDIAAAIARNEQTGRKPALKEKATLIRQLTTAQAVTNRLGDRLHRARAGYLGALADPRVKRGDVASLEAAVEALGTLFLDCARITGDWSRGKQFDGFSPAPRSVAHTRALEALLSQSYISWRSAVLFLAEKQLALPRLAPVKRQRILSTLKDLKTYDKLWAQDGGSGVPGPRLDAIERLVGSHQTALSEQARATLDQTSPNKKLRPEASLKRLGSLLMPVIGDKPSQLDPKLGRAVSNRVKRIGATALHQAVERAEAALSALETLAREPYAPIKDLERAVQKVKGMDAWLGELTSQIHRAYNEPLRDQLPNARLRDLVTRADQLRVSIGIELNQIR